jgi:glycosyltransferase involved in cell wall biosynthesis
MRRAAFAIPGDLTTVTGGYLYERRLLEGLRELGTAVDHLPLGPSFPDPSPADVAEAVAVMGAVPADRPLILDGFLVGSLPTAALSRIRAPLVGIVHHPLAHEEGLSDDRRAILRRTERDNLARIAHVLVPSPHTARILVAEYDVPPDRITVARPGTLRPTGDRAPADPPLILSVGIQHPRKGHDVLLRALALLDDVPWTAVIVGAALDPAHARELEQLRHALGLEHRVRLAGALPDAERDELARRASLFALATRYEGYGLVLDEALARGLPIVSCRTGAVPETVPPAAGLLVPVDDTAAFAGALRSVLVDEGMRAGLARASAAAGAQLPGWHDTARTAQAVLDALSG